MIATIIIVGNHSHGNYYSFLFVVFLNLYNNLNSKRYFSNIIADIDIEEINALFEIEPPFNIYSKKSHFILSKELANTQGSRKGYNLHIYKDGEEIPRSPINSYSR